LCQAAQMVMSLVRKRKMAALFAALVKASGQWPLAKGFLTLGPQCPCASPWLISVAYGSFLKPSGIVLAASGQCCHDGGRFPPCLLNGVFHP
jgi:hypothetical protein